MEAWFLREWQRNSPWQILLRPLSWLYAGFVAARRAMYRAGILTVTRVGVPVIVVGNLTVGGTGKTPLVLATVQRLAHAGFRCGIVTRGYAKQGDTGLGRVIHVVPPVAGEKIHSDEATLLATRSGVPVYAGARRADAAQALLRAHPDVNVIVSDDGLQHYALARDMEICVVDSARGLGNGALLPAGPLRESVARLDVVDAVVINDADGPVNGSRFEAGHLRVPDFVATLGNETLVSIDSCEILDIGRGLARFTGKRLVAIAGIGHPPRFFSHLARLGFTVAVTRGFPDHHPFIASDFVAIDADVILMTEKDAVKCKPFADPRMWYLQVDAILPEAFAEFVLKRLSSLAK